MPPGIFRNSSYLMTAQLFTKVVSFFYTIYLIKILGDPAIFGLYTVALSYFSLISALAEFGINRFLTRQTALLSNKKDNKNKLSELFCSVLLFRLALISVVYALFALFLRVSDPDHMRVALTLLAVSAVLPQAIAFTLDSAFVGVEKLFWSSVGLVCLNIATTLFGVFLLSNGYGVFGAVSAIVLGQIFYCLVLFIIPIKLGYRYLKETKTSPHALSFEMLREIAVGSLPYGILGVLGLIYFKIDALLVAYIRGSYEAGIYGAAYKFLEAVVFIPATVATAMFPVLARLHSNDLAQVKRLYFKSLKLLFAASFVVLLGFVVVLPILIQHFLPQYINAIPTLLILSLTIPFIFIHVPGSLVLLSSDRYLTGVIALSVITVSFNIAANLMLIPMFGYNGAAVVTVLSEALSFVVFFAFLQRQVFKRL
ncbi:hypothetical protein A2631_02530 [Candidatus Daviesbacteria bacterium RIFCSPHIGHO2_01_FULL_44_29]|uniref:Uncharacterized protein n=1 Tax=Candidatus Daviesbacteria bacterium RIFCSPHIGHO2_02_FULL_43_12 TaxID=1797776 RepID=A0A1F5KK39_9BACT|nr:MAG: hypothetical protein A2631_02530 [Candidatus Daviesbacteria bacterium RIFCSPHIGHO2_01_FULL_44_29]OGE40184.1 MAG: hypothetical protein A3E86_04375 [Candidatus Daviesbacteria bacterium RIFCSPHIGHO2_12_FULL_47_45]OGE41262.1 MAG: hypothetical protein A3D25_01925 [Candidatus Daviesbacteria bacterium RIFCSPHIGHO2_02_FULL_43_12]OGE69463.1 MAG: hypothetical protein A3B55_03665 [Candidatus Daviesbacteria bacterium RIFCSPLOWO2_01_FULL_43_15]